MNKDQVVFILVMNKNICFLVSDQVNHIPYFMGSEHDGYVKMNHSWIIGYEPVREKTNNLSSDQV